MAVNLKTLTDEELFYGAKTCQGCGALMACRMVMKVVGPKSCIAIPACCMAATTTVYPQSAIFVNNAVTAFPGLAATIAGMAAGGEVMGWDLSPKAQHSLSEAPEHLHGCSMYRRRYAALKAALNTVTVNN